jgi:hypothetical protein
MPAFYQPEGERVGMVREVVGAVGTTQVLEWVLFLLVCV